MRKLFPSMNMLAVLHDTIMATASFVLALYLRLGDRSFGFTGGAMAYYAVGFTLVLLATLLYYRTYRRVWRYTSLNDLLAIARAGTLALLIFYGASFLLTRLEAIPRSIPFIHWMTLMLCLLSARVMVRVVSDKAVLNKLIGGGYKRVPVLLIGATPQAEMFIRESERSLDFPYMAVGIVTEDGRQRGREIHGVRIYGQFDELDYIIRKLARKDRAPQRLLLTDASMAREQFDLLMNIAETNNLSISRLPSLTELKAGQQVQELHPVAVEDILGRAPAVLDKQAMQHFIRDRRVLVTGAGGSIGSELVRQIASYQPSEILLYELSEYLLYEIDRELQQDYPNLARQAVIGDVRDAGQLARTFTAFHPDMVVHAAAVKHVPLSEMNAEQAVLTNVLGSKQVADACVTHKVPVMLQISTDKAVNPTSIMGATKRVAEIYCQALAAQKHSTHFVTVRFGNVLNSAGSVVPLFQEQIASGGPLTVTHRDMTRYFMTIREATQLILQAAVLGAEHKEYAPIFVLDMGEPVRIEDLACQMIRLAGYRPHDEIKIVYTGLRPGEKLFEELFHDEENLMPTQHGSIRLARARQMELEPLNQAVALLVEAAREGRAKQVPLLIKQIVSEYQFDPVKAAQA